MARYLTMIVASAALAFTAGAVVAGSAEKSWNNPDLGLSDPERDQQHRAESEAFFARYADWVLEQNSSDLDLTSLPRAPMMATAAHPAPTISDAVRRAQYVVVGAATGLRFRPTADTVVSFRVEETLKGMGRPTLEIVFPGGLQPWPDWDHALLAVLDAAPIPKIGERIVLMVEENPVEPETVVPQSWTGLYTLDETGRLEALEGNPFGSAVSGLTIDSLRDAVEAVR